MEGKNNENTVTYQFMNYPLALQWVADSLPEGFSGYLVSALWKKVEEKSLPASCRLVRLVRASGKVESQVLSSVHSDKYGPESISVQGGYRVYRYQAHAMLVYAFSAYHWELGVTHRFFNRESEKVMTTVLTRLISFSLATEGVAGFWGEVKNQEWRIGSQSMMGTQRFFIDWKNQKCITHKEENLPAFLKIVRLDKNQKNERSLTREELLGFLLTHSTFFDDQGLLVAIRQVIQKIASHAVGFTRSSLETAAENKAVEYSSRVP
jgi:hypothetical protein